MKNTEADDDLYPEVFCLLQILPLKYLGKKVPAVFPDLIAPKIFFTGQEELFLWLIRLPFVEI